MFKLSFGCLKAMLASTIAGSLLGTVFFENVDLMPRSDTLILILEGGEGSPFPTFCSEAAHKVLQIKISIRTGVIIYLCSTYQPL